MHTKPKIFAFSRQRVNTINDFLCISAHDLGYLSPFSPTCPNSPNILKLDPQMAFTVE